MLSMDQLYNFLGWEELPGTRDELVVLRIWIDELAQKNIKFQAPNLRILGVPPEADQVSGKKTKKLKPWSL